MILCDGQWNIFIYEKSNERIATAGFSYILVSFYYYFLSFKCIYIFFYLNKYIRKYDIQNSLELRVMVPFRHECNRNIARLFPSSRKYLSSCVRHGQIKPTGQCIGDQFFIVSNNGFILFRDFQPEDLVDFKYYSIVYFFFIMRELIFLQ